ncbi:MAG: hypothetical protein WBP29_05280 [Candidatus Zixiibacteriota bacterium]
MTLKKLQRSTPKNHWRRSVTEPVLFCREFLGFEPHPGQQRWLQNSIKPQNLLVTGNRWGKSKIQAAKILHRAVFRLRNRKFDDAARYRILNLSITQDQANIIFNNCLALIRANSKIELLVENVTYSPYGRITFGNGSEITARSSQNRGEYILGNDYDYINYDEVAFELHPEYVVEEVLTMRLADRNGMMDLVSTPCGRNWFFKKFQALNADHARGYTQCGSTFENPHVSREYLDAKSLSMSTQRVQQNIQGMFVDSGNEILKEEVIQRALELSKGLSSRVADHRYVTGWDLARKRTHTVGITLDVSVKPYQLVAIDRFQKRDWPFVYEAIRQRKRAYGGDTIIDSTGLGDVVISELKDISPLGFVFTTRSKAELLTNFQSEFEAGHVAAPYFEIGAGSTDHWCLIDELREVNWEINENCDAVMALALALWAAKSATSKTPSPGFRIGEV